MKIFFALLLFAFVTACSHPIEIEGQGDVTSASGKRNCYLEDFQAAMDNCTKNYAIGAYQETYYAVTRAGWKFDHWVTYCEDATPPNYDCSFNIPAQAVRDFWGKAVPPLKAVFKVDTDQDGVIDEGDTDDDNDGISDLDDMCPLDASPTCSVDTDGDGIIDEVDSDDDGDGILDTVDECPLDASPTCSLDRALPNVIFVLDNTANWSRASQKWPGGVVQGQSEVKAIKTALAAVVGKLNVGIMEYSTGGSNAINDGGYVRFNLRELNEESLGDLNLTLDTIFANINEATEKRPSSNLYGYLPYDIYNYLSSGNQSKGGAGTPASLADIEAYTTPWSQFRSPLVSADACGSTNVIFIGNNTNGSIAGDDSTNSAALKTLYAAAGEVAPDALAGDEGTPLGMPEFISQIVEGEDIVVPEVIIPAYTIPAQVFPAADLSTSTACWNSDEAASCTTAENSAGGLCVGQQNCYCSAATTNNAGCTAQRVHWTVRTDGWTVPEQLIPEQIVPAHVIPGEDTEIFVPTGQVNTTGGLSYNFDDWAKFLYDYGIPLTINVDGEILSKRIKVTTHTIDVFNAQQSPDLSSLFFSAATAGGGRYFQAKSEQHIIIAISSALGDIMATCPIEP